MQVNKGKVRISFTIVCTVKDKQSLFDGAHLHMDNSYSSISQAKKNKRDLEVSSAHRIMLCNSIIISSKPQPKIPKQLFYLPRDSGLKIVQDIYLA